jgi:histidinol dehydrogenase
VALSRPAATDRRGIEESVKNIVNDVRNGGNRAVQLWSNKLDGFDGPVTPLPEEAFDAAWKIVEPELHDALEVAIRNVSAFHVDLVPREVHVTTSPGVVCRRVTRPLQTVGLYVPGGRNPLPSTVVMLGVPSAIAGCPTRVVCTPPRSDGSVNPLILVAARKCGLDTVFAVGGAQAVAAMAYGTETIPRCDKIFGPGNRYVDAAKRLVANDPEGAALDLPAGPSEVLIIADEFADPVFVAADLLAQAEHDIVAHAVLATTSAVLADEVERILKKMAAALPDTSTATAALSHAVIIITSDEDHLVELANQYAPEHLIINTATPAPIVDRIATAGSVFVGAWTPEVLGDYCSGTNHVLPTGGYARTYSGLSVDSFMRYMTVQEATSDGMASLGAATATLARAEGLIAHERSVLARLRAIETNTATK